MHKQRIGIILFSLLGIVSVFLPWATLLGEITAKGTAGDGWIGFALFVVTLFIAIFGFRDEAIRWGRRFKFIILASLVSSLMGTYKILVFMGIIGDQQSVEYSQAATVEYGLYLFVAAGVGLLLAAILLMGKKPKPTVIKA